MPLGEVVKPSRPRVKPSDYPNLPFIGMEHVEAHSMKLLGTVPAATMKSSAVHFKPGDVLYGRLRPYLNKVYRPTFEGLCSAEFIVLPENERVDGGYLQYFLNSSAFVRFASHLNTGDRPRVDFDQLVPYGIPLPDPEEQRRIVAELEKQFSRLDEAVANLKRVKANLKRYKAAVLAAAVKGRIGARGVASDDDLPIGWQWSSVGELATVGTGATPARSNGAFYRDGTIPWITSSAVNEPFVEAADQFVTDEALRQTNLTLYPPGTLLVAMYGEGKTRGKCSELRISATTNQALAVLQVEPTVRPWLKLFLEHNYDNTRRIASGGVQPNLNLGLIRAIRLPLPPQEEQELIVAEVDRCLSIVRELEAEVDANLKRAQALRQAVLASAFTGTPLYGERQPVHDRRYRKSRVEARSENSQLRG